VGARIVLSIFFKNIIRETSDLLLLAVLKLVSEVVRPLFEQQREAHLLP
jgi:hypothetical protein